MNTEINNSFFFANFADYETMDRSYNLLGSSLMQYY